ncbi:MAG: histidine phosphatase family protein [Candidatus Staskawiczbacteria bacterium]|nr:histidine phosphatase family protein [Candidatus Staskawiczbacteria bacterium]
MKMNNKYYILRHGQTIYQKENRGMNYEPDSPQKLEITQEGKKMVKNSAENLKNLCMEQGFDIDVIIASPFLRTKQSAKIAADILGIKEIKYDDRLVDINLGEFLGRPQKESTDFYSRGTNLFDNRPFNGESWNDVLKRIKSFADEIEEKYSNKNILIISHADPIWLMIGYLRGLKGEEQFMEARHDRENFYPKVGQLIKV